MTSAEYTYAPSGMPFVTRAIVPGAELSNSSLYTTAPPYGHDENLLFAFDSDAFKAVAMVVYAMIFVIGVPGNILVLLTLIRIKKMRSVKNIFIGNLAVGDLLNLLWCMTSFALGLYIPWPFGTFVCTYIYPMSDVIIGNTIFTMAAIACDRYRAIVQPFAPKLTIKRSFLILILLWVSAYLVMAFPLTLVNQIIAGAWVSKVCTTVFQSRSHELSYRLTIFIATYIVPLILVLFCYVRIRKQLYENIKFASNSIRGLAKLQRAKKNERLIQMLLVLFVAFTICYLPINFILLAHLFYREEVEGWPYISIAFQLAGILIFGNSVLNPIILFLMSREYKSGFYSNLSCIFCCQSRFPDRRLSESMTVLKSWVGRSSSRFRRSSVISNSTTFSADDSQTSRKSSSSSSFFSRRRSSIFSSSLCFNSASSSDLHQAESSVHLGSPQLINMHYTDNAYRLYFITAPYHQEQEISCPQAQVEDCGAVVKNEQNDVSAASQAIGNKDANPAADLAPNRQSLPVGYNVAAPRKSVTWAKQKDLLEDKPLVVKGGE